MGIVISVNDKNFLLSLARKALEKFLFSGIELEISDKEIISETLNRNLATFVTIRNHKTNTLRGCVGHLEPVLPLYKDVIANAISAATADNRFDPVSYTELPDLRIEISVLSPFTYQGNFSDKKILGNVDYGTGVYITDNQGHSATYLPDVWEELPDKSDFFDSICEKAGLTKDFWKKMPLRVYTYSTIKFEEEG
ncbi:MAG: AmmeMemoRadiSam system protein A [Candidatus Magasanikbacteria bacterium]|nr:AmmeMemoRadiSam system protein A [Candidatus Magasanikbacteria bacterium]